MARIKSAASIDAEIQKIDARLARLQKQQETLTDRLMELQKLKQEQETRQIMEAFHKSGKTMAELMIFLEG